LEKAIVSSFGSVDEFKAEFEKQATRLFGSGWVWLIKTEGGKLRVVSTQNQDNPLMDVSSEQGLPILSIDVWEHAYYLAYQNRRTEYVKNFWRIVDWDQVSKNFRVR
jgi:Fe-Mn family superoxide dismutase